ncbi:MAG: cupin domain-containing protein [Polyangiaceae bacterium]|nr:cupin domain-containing protein [Polyangiaceae bacterium]
MKRALARSAGAASVAMLLSCDAPEPVAPRSPAPPSIQQAPASASTSIAPAAVVSAVASVATTPAAGAFLPAAFPKSPPRLDDRVVCDRGTCVATLALSKAPVAPSDAPSVAHLWEHQIAPGATLTVPRDDAFAVIAVVLEGSAHDTPVIEDEPTPDGPLEPLTGVFYRGGGFSLRAEGGAARVLLASVLRRDLGSFKTKGSTWSKRPTGSGDSIVRFDLRTQAFVFGGGKMNAILGLEDRKDRAPDASCSLLGIAAGGAVPEHVHANEWELLAIVSGDGRMSLGEGPNKASRDVKPGNIVHIPKGVLHAFQSTSTEPVIAIQLYTPPGPEQRFKAAR